MALGSVEPQILCGPDNPRGAISDWFDANTAPQTADNSGNIVLNPGALSRAEIKVFKPSGRGTTVEVRLRYRGTVTTPPIVQLFGLDRNGMPQRLVDVDGNHELTFSADATNDCTKTIGGDTVSFSAPQEVDMNNASEVMITIKTALVGTSTSNSPTIQCRIK